MQIKLFTIPVSDPHHELEAMNAFLRSKKILQTEQQLVVVGQSAFWCFCISWIDAVATTTEKIPVDYRKILDEATFERFSKLRAIRKQIAQEDGIPAYTIFTDEELVGLSKLDSITPASMKAVRGIGEKKIEKYAAKFSIT